LFVLAELFLYTIYANNSLDIQVTMYTSNNWLNMIR